MIDMDTGDTVVCKLDNEVYIVACVHGHYLHTAGYPEKRLMVGDCVVKDTCTDSQRREAIKRMAASTGTGHRPECARKRLAETEANEFPDYYGCLRDLVEVSGWAVVEYHGEYTASGKASGPVWIRLKTVAPSKTDTENRRPFLATPLIEGGIVRFGGASD